MNREECLQHYVNSFCYQEVAKVSQSKKIYAKETSHGLVFIESDLTSTIATFLLNEQTKFFKKSDLLLCALEGIPAAWEAENE
jgi:predicted flavoprotein YhiN